MHLCLEEVRSSVLQMISTLGAEKLEGNQFRQSRAEIQDRIGSARRGRHYFACETIVKPRAVYREPSKFVITVMTAPAWRLSWGATDGSR